MLICWKLATVYLHFFSGSRKKTKNTGLLKKDLMKSKSGKIVSKRTNKAGKASFKRNGLHKWNQSFMQAKDALGISGFVLCKK